jgi:hypothetical protein
MFDAVTVLVGSVVMSVQAAAPERVRAASATVVRSL